MKAYDITKFIAELKSDNVQYEFVLHCCDVIALCTASQISNKEIKYITLLLVFVGSPLTYSTATNSQ